MDWENYKTEYERSYKSYQHVFVEVLFSGDHYLFQNALKEDVIFDLSPELNELRMELYDEIIILLDTLTETQKEIMTLVFLEGVSQSEIAKRRNVNQSSINKVIFGNYEYINGKRRTFGGACAKLKKEAKKSTKIQSILKEISEIQRD